MAEVQTTTESGEMTQRFIEFVMMHAQNAALFLGQIPNPRGGTPEVNLDIARMFIDQLVMIRAKTKGNLSNDELGVLNNAISNLQVSFFEVSQQQKAGGAAAAPSAGSEEAESAPAATEAQAAEPAPEAAPAPESDESNESKKKFSKSYGAS